MRKCCIKSIFITLALLMLIPLTQELWYIKLYKGDVIEKAMVGTGGIYTIKIRDESGDIKVLSISDDVILLKFNRNKLFDNIKVNTYYRFYTHGSDANIEFYE